MKDVFVARQPIFDAKHRIKAYELLFRDTAAADAAGNGHSASTMSSSVIVDGVLGMGLGRLTEGQTAFVNVPERLLLDGVHEVLDPAKVVIELLETVRPTPEVIEACRTLKGLGFRIALDDFAYDPSYHPLLELGDVVKVDVLVSVDRLEQVVEELRPFGAQLLAEKVEDGDVHRRCVELGFELFQGFHYFKPETVTNKDVGAQSISIIRLMSLLGDMNVTDRAIEEAFRSDPSLSYKLLRLVNSAALGGRGVDSIAHAMRLMGREPLHRWLSLLLLTVRKGGGEMRVEMIKSALLRGRMCELIGDAVRSAMNRDVPAGGTLFLVGLFSHLDVLLGDDMTNILENIDVTREVKDALLSHEGKAGTILRGVVDYTDAEWEAAEEHLSEVGLEPDVLGDVYMDSIAWAGAHMALHESD